MSDWVPDQLDHIGAADELEITTRRPDGSLRGWVPTWVVPVDDDLYIRSYRGADGARFRHATAPPAVPASGSADWNATSSSPRRLTRQCIGRSTRRTGTSTAATAAATSGR
jgi:hypothetical protein